MKIILNDTSNIEFNSKDDLLRLIPESSEGEVLNYGQGEGQVKIDNTIWGVYVSDENYYYITYEEGEKTWEQLKILVDNIADKLAKESDVKIQFILKGSLTNNANA